MNDFSQLPIALSLDGNYLYISYYQYISEWNVATSTVRRVLTPPFNMTDPVDAFRDGLREMIVHPNGKLLFSCYRRGIVVWDLPSGTVLRILQAPNDNRYWYRGLVLTPDGKYIFNRLYAEPGHSAVFQWNAETGDFVKNITAPQFIELRSADNTYIYGTLSGIIHQWEIDSGKSLDVIPATVRNNDSIHSLLVSADRKSVFVGFNGTIHQVAL